MAQPILHQLLTDRLDHPAGRAYLAPMAWTFRKLIGAQHAVTAYCDNQDCHHSQTLDLQALGDRLGMDAEAMASDLKPKLRCTKCGGRAISLIYSPPTGRKR